DQTRKTLPAWIPDPVWADVKANVAAIDIVGVVLPVYQRYFSQQDGEGMQLMYEGPTGQQYAKLALKSRLDAMNQGLRGSAADVRAMQADEAANLDALLRKRMTELTPDELARYHSFDDHANRSLGGDIWRQLDDQQDVLIRTKVNQVFQATMKAHNAELVAAQQAYLAKHPAKQ